MVTITMIAFIFCGAVIVGKLRVAKVKDKKKKRNVRLGVAIAS